MRFAVTLYFMAPYYSYRNVCGVDIKLSQIVGNSDSNALWSGCPYILKNSYRFLANCKPATLGILEILTNRMTITNVKVCIH